MNHRPLALTVVLLLAAAVSVRAEKGWTCASPPVEPCAVRHGRLSSQNGVSLRLWLIGTTRVVSLTNDVDALPPDVTPYLQLTSDDHGHVFGDFVVCFLEPDTPGRMRQACVSGAKKLVVQPLRRPGPAFRIRSTW